MDSSYLLGLVYIVCTAVLWAGSSVLIQFIYTLDGKSDNSTESSSTLSPFLITYIGISLFTLLLPAEMLTDYRHKMFCFMSYEYGGDYERIGSFQERVIVFEEENSTCESKKSTSSPPLTEIDESVSTLYPDDDEDEDDDNSSRQTKPWTEKDHFWLAIQIAPVWFLGNWAGNASLQFTSVSASMVMASTTPLFTFLMALALRDDKFTFMKLGGVILGIVGSVLTAINDDKNEAVAKEFPFAIWGDFLAILSAIGYATYAVQTHLLCPRDDSLYSMYTLLGYVGLISMIALSPVAIYQIVSLGGISKMSFMFGILNGIFDNVLSDFFCLRSVVLTDATVASVGLGLVIPLAFLFDILMGKGENVTGIYSLLGALAVAIGFLLVNLPAAEGNDICTSLPSSPEVSSNDMTQYQNMVIRLRSVNEESTSSNHINTTLRVTVVV